MARGISQICLEQLDAYSSAPAEEVIHINERSIRFQCSNYGRTPALLRDIWMKAVFENTPPTPPYNFGTASHWTIHVPLAMGEKSRIYDYKIPEAIEITNVNEGVASWQIPAIPEGQKMFFILDVRYLDPAGVRHTTSDCWEFIPGNNVFFRVEDLACHSMS